VGLSQFDERQPLAVGGTMLNASGLGPQILPPSAILTPVRIDKILVTNTDAIPHLVTLALQSTGPNVILGSAIVPAGQGTAGTPSFDLLAAAVPAITGITMDASNSLVVTLAVAVVAPNELDFAILGGYL
jgi:hypothetical protein